MKTAFRVSLCGLIFLVGYDCFGQLESSSRIKPMDLKDLPKREEKKPAPPTVLPPPVKPPTLYPKQAKYYYPGILVYRQGEWKGGDNLLNVSKNIGVYVSILKPGDELLGITEDLIQKQIESIFQKASISTQITGVEGEPPLPFFRLKFSFFQLQAGILSVVKAVYLNPLPSNELN